MLVVRSRDGGGISRGANDGQGDERACERDWKSAARHGKRGVRRRDMMYTVAIIVRQTSQLKRGTDLQWLHRCLPNTEAAQSRCFLLRLLC